MSKSDGLRFGKFDLHVHTPASITDYEDKSTTPEIIVQQALSKGLMGIAITDHQTAGWVDKMREAGKKSNLVVFPGVELNVTGGERGIHLLLLFDVDKDQSHVQQFLHRVEAYETGGKPKVHIDKTVSQIAEELHRYDPTALLLLAHCHSSKGVTGDMKGEPRSIIFERDYPCLVGAQASEADFQDEEKKKKGVRVLDLFDGTKKEYGYKKLGVFIASDAHSPGVVGSGFSYFKVDEPVTIEDIRQSLGDRETRIQQAFEFRSYSYPRINSLSVTSGFLKDQVLVFHSGLNSILGAKGSGKSLAIELLRFGLNQEPSNLDLLQDHKSKLEKCLKIYGKTEIVITDESSRSYLIRRVYNPAENNPIEILDASTQAKRDFSIQQLFPVLFLSQNEVIKIAEDHTGTSQRAFIDRFFDFFSFQQEIERSKQELAEADSRFADTLRGHLAFQALQSRGATIKEEIAKLERQITNNVFSEYSKSEQLGNEIRKYQEFVENLTASFQGNLNEYEPLNVPLSSYEEDEEQPPEVKRTRDLAQSALNKSIEAIQQAISTLGQDDNAISKELATWALSFETIKGKYEKVVKESGGDQVTLDQKRKTYVKQLSEIDKEAAKHQAKAQQIKVVSERRANAIAKLEAAYKAYFEERNRRCQFFTDKSAGVLEVSVKEKEDTSGFRSQLMRFKRGSWLKEEEIETITRSIEPAEFVNTLMRFEWSGRARLDTLDSIVVKTGMKTENVHRLAMHILEEFRYEEILGLLHTSAPNDLPVIKYQVNGIFKDLQELSVGQKAITLLIIALSDGRFPIVIDQPEDSLDLRTIWDDVCQKFRSSKESRQFVFTTHNSSVAVASDSDKFTILEAGPVSAKIVYSGSINRPVIRKEILDYLEGGSKTYHHKRRNITFKIAVQWIRHQNKNE